MTTSISGGREVIESESAHLSTRIDWPLQHSHKLAKSRNKTGIPVTSPIYNAIFNIETSCESLEDEVESIKNIQNQNLPIDKDRRRKIDSDLKTFENKVVTMQDGLEFALDTRSPSPFVWVVFFTGTAVLIGVLIYYISLHANRPTSPQLQGISDAQRLQAIDALTALRVQAAFLEELSARESAFKNEDDKKAMTSLRENIHKTLRDTADTLKVMTSVSADTGSLYAALQDEISPKNSTAEGTQHLNAKAIMIYSNQLGKTVRELPEPYFWERGAKRYAEVLFASFFGVMAFALYNWWKQMRRPARGWWFGWYVAKIFLALMVSFIFVAILSQVNFTTPTSLQSQTAFGLGTAPMEIVIAVSMLAGYFGHKALDALEGYAERLFSSLAAG